MNHTKRNIIVALSLVGLALLQGVCPSYAADNLQAARDFFKGKTISLYIPGSPGGGTDIPARLIAPYLEKELGATVLPENLNAAGGAICYTTTATSRPDGLTICLVTVPAFVSCYLTGQNRFHPLDSYDSLGQLLVNDTVICVKGDSPYNTLEEAMEHARANPEAMSWAGTGATSVKTLIGLTFRNFGVNFRLINWDGDNECIVAVMGGHADITGLTAATIGKYVEAGDLKPLAVVGDNRLEELPNVPATTELGYKFPLIGTTHGLVVPTGMDADKLEVLRIAFKNILHDDGFQKAGKNATLTLNYGEPEKFDAFTADTLTFLDELGVFKRGN
jgi:Uncharacterized protein conserved in bacteria